jgi:hypothetical protein
MSLIPLAAELVRRAASDENYAMDLDACVRADESAFEGLVNARIDTPELGWLSPSDWLWFLRWRQSRGGSLQPVVLDFLASIGASRAARFQLRFLVMRDAATEEWALRSYEVGHAESVGLTWLDLHARASADSEEVARDALQAATEPAWFTLRVLTSLDDRRSTRVRTQLLEFAHTNEIGNEITSRWTSRGEL